MHLSRWVQLPFTDSPPEDHLAPTNILQGPRGEVPVLVKLCLPHHLLGWPGRYLLGWPGLQRQRLQASLSLTGVIWPDYASFFMPPVFHFLPRDSLFPLMPEALDPPNIYTCLLAPQAMPRKLPVDVRAHRHATGLCALLWMPWIWLLWWPLEGQMEQLRSAGREG